MVSFFKIGNSQKYFSACKNMTKTQSKALRSEFKDFVHYYKDNASVGWHDGKRLSQIRDYGKTKSYLVKLYAAISKTKIRAKDVPPAILGAAGAMTPIPGASLVGFGIGTAIPKVFKILIKKFSKH